MARRRRTPVEGKVVVFDVGGVLIRWDDALVMEKAGRVLGVPAEDLRREMVRVRPALQAGRIDLDGFWDRIGSRVHRTVPPRVRELWWRELDRRAHPRREVVRWARALRSSGLRTAMFSNTDASHARFFARPWSSGFVPRLLSYELGATKPHAEAFRRAGRRLNAQPGDVLLLDDVLGNVRAARAAGWKAHHFRDLRGARAHLRTLGWWVPSSRGRSSSRTRRRGGGDAFARRPKTPVPLRRTD